MAFWQALRIGGDEVEGFTTLGAMTRAADVVGVGRIVSFDLGRMIQGGTPEDIVGYGAAKLELDEAIGGPAQVEPITLEFLLPGHPDNYKAMVKDLQGSVPVGPVLVFLRHTGGNEAGLFRLVNSRGLWTSTPRSGVDAPLTEAGGVDFYGHEIGDFTELDQLVAYVKSQSGP